MKVADEVWVSLALLHRENPERADFAVSEIKRRAKNEDWVIRPGFNVHASYHCLASKPANPANHRMLEEDSRGRKRLYRQGDPVHPERENGKTRPDKVDLPPEYQPLIDWYDEIYSKGASQVALPSVTVQHQFPSEKSTDLAFAFEEMHSQTAFLGPGGTVVLPEHLQKGLNLREGSCLSIYRDKDRIVLLPITEDFIAKLRGSLKGDFSLLEDREREHRIEKHR